MGALGLLLCLAVLPAACTSGSSSPSCGALTSAGCCTSDGACETLATLDTCGVGGTACVVCSNSQQCILRQCEPVDAGTDAGPGGGPTITISNYAYSPTNLTVEPGATVTVTNQDGVAHTVTSQSAFNNYVPGAVDGV